MNKKNNKIILTMMGVDTECVGGISTLTSTLIPYIASNKLVDFSYIATSNQRSAISKMTAFLSALMRLHNRLKDNRLGVVHIHMADNASIYRANACIDVARRHRQKTIVHVHCDLFNIYKMSSWRMQRAIANALVRADRIIALGSYLFEVTDYLGIRRDRVAILPNAVDCPKRNTYNASADRILFLGNLCKDKGVIDLLDAMVLLRDKLPTYMTLDLCGRDLMGVSREISKRGLSTRVQYVGIVQPDDEFFSHYALNVLPSHKEALPLSLLEASAHGIPSVVSSVGSIAEVVSSGKNGELVAPHDPCSLSKAIQKLVSDTDLRKRMSCEIYRLILENYSMATYSLDLANIYESLLERK